MKKYILVASNSVIGRLLRETKTMARFLQEEGISRKSRKWYWAREACLTWGAGCKEKKRKLLHLPGGHDGSEAEVGRRRQRLMGRPVEGDLPPGSL